MGGSASTRRIAPRANQPPCLLEPVTAEVYNSQAPIAKDQPVSLLRGGPGTCKNPLPYKWAGARSPERVS